MPTVLRYAQTLRWDKTQGNPAAAGQINYLLQTRASLPLQYQHLMHPLLRLAQGLQHRVQTPDQVGFICIFLSYWGERLGCGCLLLFFHAFTAGGVQFARPGCDDDANVQQ